MNYAAQYKKTEKYGIWYSVPTAEGEWADRYIRCNGKEKLNSNISKIKKLGYKLSQYKKLYPFNMEENQHNFELISNICYNKLYDIWSGELKATAEEEENLEKTREKAEEFFCEELPIAWVPYEKWTEMKELACAAEIHRDIANRRGRG